MEKLALDKTLIDNLIVKFSDLGMKLLAAFAIWIIGRWLIKFGLNLIVSRLEKRKVDHTIVGYARNTASVALNIALVVVLMGVLGIETTSFAAFIAGAGLAIGAAWSGLLSNLAAGAFLVILRPFKAGDQITGGAVKGTVVEVGLFVTTLITEDGVQAYIGNSKILSATIRNFSTRPTRRLDLVAAIPREENPDHAIAEIKAELAKVANVAADPAPEIRILSVEEYHFNIAIRPHVADANYWQVHFDIIDALRDKVHSIALAAHDHSHGEEGELGEGAGGGEGEEE